ncbi:hypothetical protein A2955_02270 [Candidatus Woesebacteria bacterium RIFCSPLOWO2_01_FULL_37_19]|uniref:DUF7282 domain-containing protein n=1 Tax=Candidatus Woesebacteria bacterium RIFCSPLOWO2_01_FULL_37_19 TaxID=1802514 RepID=A0A1F8B9W8_9BACT|nr:MAG: hypothetical protein A2955_02270 [Candidatus Woesebacteria bacterium RIFCSPLOWO2_01_FULL_37_19]
MIKRVLLFTVLGIIIGTGAFLIQVQRGDIKLSDNEDKAVNEGTEEITETPTEEEILGDKIYYVVVPLVAGDIVEVESVKLLIPGYVVVYEKEDLESSSVLGVSSLLNPTLNNDIEVKLKRKIVNGETVYVGLNSDNGNKKFDSPSVDIPIMTRGAIPVRRKYVVGE